MTYISVDNTYFNKFTENNTQTILLFNPVYNENIQNIANQNINLITDKNVQRLPYGMSLFELLDRLENNPANTSFEQRLYLYLSILGPHYKLDFKSLLSNEHVYLMTTWCKLVLNNEIADANVAGELIGKYSLNSLTAKILKTFFFCINIYHQRRGIAFFAPFVIPHIHERIDNNYDFVGENPYLFNNWLKIYSSPVLSNDFHTYFCKCKQTTRTEFLNNSNLVDLSLRFYRDFSLPHNKFLDLFELLGKSIEPAIAILETQPHLMKSISSATFQNTAEFYLFLDVVQNTETNQPLQLAFQELVCLGPAHVITWVRLFEKNSDLDFLHNIIFFMKSYPGSINQLCKFIQDTHQEIDFITLTNSLQEWLKEANLLIHLPLLFKILNNSFKQEKPYLFHNLDEIRRTQPLLLFKLFQHLTSNPQDLRILCSVGSLSFQTPHFLINRLEKMFTILQEGKMEHAAISKFLDCCSTPHCAGNLLWSGINNNLEIVNSIFRYTYPIHTAIIIWHLLEQFKLSSSTFDLKWNETFTTIYQSNLSLNPYLQAQAQLPYHIRECLHLLILRDNLKLADQLLELWINDPSKHPHIELCTILIQSYGLQTFVTRLIENGVPDDRIFHILAAFLQSPQTEIIEAFAKVYVNAPFDPLKQRIIENCILWMTVFQKIPEDLQLLVKFASGIYPDHIVHVFNEAFSNPRHKPSLSLKYAMIHLRKYNDIFAAYYILTLPPHFWACLPYNFDIEQVHNQALIHSQLALDETSYKAVIEMTLYQTRALLQMPEGSFYPDIITSDYAINYYVNNMVSNCVNMNCSIDLDIMRKWLNASHELKQFGFSNIIGSHISNFIKNPQFKLTLEMIDVSTILMDERFALLLKGMLNIPSAGPITKRDIIRGILLFLFSKISQAASRHSCAATSILIHIQTNNVDKAIQLMLKLLEGKLSITKENKIYDSILNLTVDTIQLKSNFKYQIGHSTHILLTSCALPLKDHPSVLKLSRYLGIDQADIEAWIKSALYTIPPRHSTIPVNEITHELFLKKLLLQASHFIKSPLKISSDQLEYECTIVYLSVFEPLMTRALESTLMQFNMLKIKKVTSDTLNFVLEYTFKKIIRNQNLPQLESFTGVLIQEIIKKIDKLSILYDHNLKKSKGCNFFVEEDKINEFPVPYINSYDKFKAFLEQSLIESVNCIYATNKDYKLLKGRLDFFVKNFLNSFSQPRFEKRIISTYNKNLPSPKLTSPWKQDPGVYSQYLWQSLGLLEPFHIPSKISYPVKRSEDVLDFLHYYVTNFDITKRQNQKRVGNMYGHSMNFIFFHPMYIELATRGLEAVKNKYISEAQNFSRNRILTQEEYDSWFNLLKMTLKINIEKLNKYHVPFEKLHNRSLKAIYDHMKDLLQKANLPEADYHSALKSLDSRGITLLNKNFTLVELNFIPFIDTNWISRRTNTQRLFSLFYSPLSFQWEFWSHSSCGNFFNNETYNDFFGEGKCLEICVQST
ncbi:MAG: hypothetical protein WC222_01215 [Parachlamydiales bacterium]|jgi:hypothetical protein